MNTTTRQLPFQILPWQQTIWTSLNQARHQNRLHHALLFIGMPGLGKTSLAQYLAQSVFCTTPRAEGQPCGHCRDCHLFLAGNHPDFRQLIPDPESKSGEIVIDAIRDLGNLDHLTTRPGRYKIIMIHPADALNSNAANGLLKTLEEPGTHTLLLLITAQPGRLPATVRSRCATVLFHPPSEEQALTWLNAEKRGGDALLALRLAHGAPLGAVKILDAEFLAQRHATLEVFIRLGRGQSDPLVIAAEWVKLDLMQLFEWLSGWLADMLRLQVHPEAAYLDNPDQAAVLGQLAATRDAVMLHRLWSQAVQARSHIRRNLNAQLLLETLLIQWSPLLP